MKHTISKIINIVLIGLIGYLLLQKFVLNRPTKDIDVNQLVITDLEGERLDWSDLEGKAVFLNFWASWCGPCMAEMPSIIDSANHFKNEDIVYIIANTQSIADAKAVQQKEKYKDIPFYYMNTRNAPIEINSIPATYLIDYTGKVKNVHVGLNHWNSPIAKKQIKNLLE